MDTNSDGKVDMWDDMYTPFYPGDDWVDWVGMSIFHFGQVSWASLWTCWRMLHVPLQQQQWPSRACRTYSLSSAAIGTPPAACLSSTCCL